MGEHKLEKMEPIGSDKRIDPDKLAADEIRKDAFRILNELVAVQDRANKCGLTLQFQITRNPIGLHMLSDLTVLKVMMP